MPPEPGIMLGPRSDSVTGCCIILEDLFPLGELDRVLMATVNSQVRDKQDKEGSGPAPITASSG